MPSSNDVRIRYEAGESKAVLSFDGGLQSVGLAVVPMGTGPVSVVTTVEQLVAAVGKAGAYRVAKGSYGVNLVMKVAGVSLTCDAGAVFQAKDVSQPVVRVLASDVVVVGGEWRGGPSETFVVGALDAKTVEAQPDRVTLTGLTLVAPAAGAVRGFALHGRHITLRSCRVEGYWITGRDSQGVWVNNGPGPYTLEDCYVEGSGENFMAGGSPIAIPNCVPSDITVTGCTFFKPDIWRTNGATVKNLFELKVAERVLVEDCVFDGCWVSAQSGHAIVLTVRNSESKIPWATVNHVVFRHNIVRHSTQGYGVNILGKDDGGRASVQMTHLEISDNLFEHCTGGIQVANGVTESFLVTRNTWPAVTSTILIFANTTIPTNLTMTENVAKSGVYGLFCSGVGKGEIALQKSCSAYVFVRNVIERSVYTSNGTPVVASIPWPAGNTILPPGGLTYGPDYTYAGEAGWSGTPGSTQTAIEPAVVDVVTEEDVVSQMAASEEAMLVAERDGG